MGNCLIAGDAVPIEDDEREEEDFFSEDFLPEFDVDYFKVAVQNCVSVSVGVASRNVSVNNVTKSSWLDGVDVMYTVTDDYELSTAESIAKHIDSSISSGKFTSLLHQHGFLSAFSTELITVAELTNENEDATMKPLTVHITQTMSGIDLPLPKVEFERVERADSFASISGLKHLIKKARNSLVQRSNSYAPISAPSTQVSQHSSNLPAAELDYSTPAFRNALQQSAATAAGVPMESVRIIDITPTPSGTELEVIYSVEGDKQLESISDFKARIDQAVAGGWFTSSLQGDGYFCVSATAPTTLIHMAFTLKQTISLVSLLPLLTRTDDSSPSNTDDRRKRSSRTLVSEDSQTTLKSKAKIGDRPEMKEVERIHPMDLDLDVIAMLDEIPAEAPPTSVEILVAGDVELAEAEAERKAELKAKAASRLNDDDIRAQAELTKMSDELSLTRRESKNWASSQLDRLLKAQAALDSQEPEVNKVRAFPDEIPVSTKKKTENSGGADSPVEEVKSEASPTSPYCNRRYSFFESSRPTSVRELEVRFDEERRLLALQEEVARLKEEDEAHTQKEADERLLRIEDLHRLREIKKQFAASAAKLKVEEVFRHKKEKGRAIALAAKLRRDSDWDSRKIRLEDSKHAFEEVKLKSVKQNTNLDRATIEADEADVTHRRGSIRPDDTARKMLIPTETRRSSVGDVWRMSMGKKKSTLAVSNSSDGDDAFDLVPKKEAASPRIRSSLPSPNLKSAFDTYIAGEEEDKPRKHSPRSSSGSAKRSPRLSTDSSWGASSMWQSLSGLGSG